MPTDTSEKGLETLIEKYLLEQNGYFRGKPSDFNTDYALDCDKLELFLCSTQEDKVQRSVDFKNPHIRHSFFDRLKNEITKRGVIDVIRRGYNYNTTMADYYYLERGEQEPFGLNNGGGVATPKTEEEMKSKDFAKLLGDEFVYDSGLNDGYPVLSWEKE
jgi:hypothetical protein